MMARWVSADDGKAGWLAVRNMIGSASIQTAVPRDRMPRKRCQNQR